MPALALHRLALHRRVDLRADMVMQVEIRCGAALETPGQRVAGSQRHADLADLARGDGQTDRSLLRRGGCRRQQHGLETDMPHGSIALQNGATIAQGRP
jgi:hypothetical protein